MKKCLVVLLVLAGFLMLSGCSTPSSRIVDVKLGMTPGEVMKVMGKPYTVRAAKLYTDEEKMEVWEYLPNFFQLYPKSYWIFFEGGKVVQWGEPGDLTAGVPSPPPGSVSEFMGDRSKK